MTRWSPRIREQTPLRLCSRTLHRRNSEKSVSLLEAMIATTIAAISITAILTSFSAAFVTGKDNEIYAEAVLLLETLESQLRMGELSPFDVNTGEFKDGEFVWTVAFQSTDLENLYLVDLSIEWERGHGKRSIKITTYHYQEVTV